MPVLPLILQPAPQSVAASFLTGEFALGFTSPHGAAPSYSQYFAARNFIFDGGEYELTISGYASIQVYVSKDQRTGRRIAAFDNRASGEVVHTLRVYLPRGRHRIDVLVNTLETKPSGAWFIFRLTRKPISNEFPNTSNIYRTTSQGWVFDGTPIADADVPALAGETVGSIYVAELLALRVLTIPPNWANPIIEQLNYSTEVLSSESNVEQRRQLRSGPRRSFELSYTLHGSQRSRLYAFLEGVGREDFLLPLWHSFATSDSDVSIGAASFSVPVFEGDLSRVEIEPGCLVLLLDEPTGRYEIGRVTQMLLEDSRFRVEPVASDGFSSWKRGFRVYRLIRARSLENPSMSHLTTQVGEARVRFQAVEPFTWLNASLASGFVPVFNFNVNRASPVSVAFDANGFVVDDDIGTPVVEPAVLNRPNLVMRSEVLLKGRSEVHNYRKFLQVVAGRRRSFLAGRNQQDLEFMSVIDVLGQLVQIGVRKIGLSDSIRNGISANTSWIGMVMKNGQPTRYWQVRGFREGPVYDELAIDYWSTNDDFPFPDEVLKTFWMSPSRFEQDTFELEYLVADDQSISGLRSPIVRTSIATRTLSNFGFESDPLDVPTSGGSGPGAGSAVFPFFEEWHIVGTTGIGDNNFPSSFSSSTNRFIWGETNSGTAYPNGTPSHVYLQRRAVHRVYPYDPNSGIVADVINRSASVPIVQWFPVLQSDPSPIVEMVDQDKGLWRVTSANPATGIAFGPRGVFIIGRSQNNLDTVLTFGGASLYATVAWEYDFVSV